MTFNFSNDLACYSLARSVNVPASVLDSHHCSYRGSQTLNDTFNGTHSTAISAARPPSPSPTPPTSTSTSARPTHTPTAISTSTSTPSHVELGMELGKKNTLIETPASTSACFTKLDLLIHTATSVSLSRDNGAFHSTHPSKYHSLGATPTTSLDSTIPSKRKMPTSLPPSAIAAFPIGTPSCSGTSTLDFLCNHAEKVLAQQMDHANQGQEANTKIDILVETQGNVSNIDTIDVNTAPQTNTNVQTPLSRTFSAVKRRRKSNKTLLSNNNTPALPSSASASNHLAIKLASPSNHSKRQRSGPSCDCCRSRKIKCDSEIFILSTLDSISGDAETRTDQLPNSDIAHCEFISLNPNTGYQYYKIIKDEEHDLNNRLTSFNYLQFKPCSACTTKNLKCSFSKGFTRNDIIKFNKSEKSMNSIVTPANSTLSTSASTPIPSNLPSSSNSGSGSDRSSPTTPLLKQESTNPRKLKHSLRTPSPTPASTPTPNSSLDLPSDYNNSKSTTTASSASASLSLQASSTSLASSSLSAAVAATSSSFTAPTAGKSSKKTSCNTCRFKKIKCVKVENADNCGYCQKKNIKCRFD
ncbi:unnamed protein product [Pichia kudriavzevii]